MYDRLHFLKSRIQETQCVRTFYFFKRLRAFCVKKKGWMFFFIDLNISFKNVVDFYQTFLHCEKFRPPRVLANFSFPGTYLLRDRTTKKL